jgi:hypothetical protein
VTQPPLHQHLPALALTLAVYAALALSCLGWGVVTARLLRVQGAGAMTLVWLGWAATVLIFQVVHCAVPLNAFATVPVFLAGIAVSIPRLAFFLRHRPIQAAGLLLVFAAVAAWIASRSMLPPALYDAGLYHLNTIRWIETYRIVPGLGNLHGRLAFNQSFFAWAAALDLAPLLPNGSRMANGFLVLLTAATLLERLRPIAARPALLRESHPFEVLPSLLALPILVHLALSSPGLASPTPDLPAELLQLVMFVTFAAVIERWQTGKDASMDDTALLAILGATAITLKLSNLAFAGAVMAISLAIGRRERGSLRALVLAAIMLAVWMARGYVWSGAPLYPSTLGYVAFDWAVPRAEVAQMATLIRGWARQPNPHWRMALDNWTWIGAWIERLRLYHVDVIVPLRAGAFFLAAAGALLLRRKPRRPREWMLVVPVLCGLLFWFFTAPDPRFAHALFFCLAASAALLLLASAQPSISRRAFAWIACAVFALTYGPLALETARERAEIARISLTGWHPLPTTRLIRRTTTSGLPVFIPAKGDQCWDAPLPCTPYFRVDLKTRVPGELSSGFTVRDKR